MHFPHAVEFLLSETRDEGNLVVQVFQNRFVVARVPGGLERVNVAQSHVVLQYSRHGDVLPRQSAEPRWLRTGVHHVLHGALDHVTAHEIAPAAYPSNAMRSQGIWVRLLAQIPLVLRVSHRHEARVRPGHVPVHLADEHLLHPWNLISGPLAMRPLEHPVVHDRLCLNPKRRVEQAPIDDV